MQTLERLINNIWVSAFITIYQGLTELAYFFHLLLGSIHELVNHLVLDDHGCHWLYSISRSLIIRLNQSGVNDEGISLLWWRKKSLVQWDFRIFLLRWRYLTLALLFNRRVAVEEVDLPLSYVSLGPQTISFHLIVVNVDITVVLDSCEEFLRVIVLAVSELRQGVILISWLEGVLVLKSVRLRLDLVDSSVKLSATSSALNALLTCHIRQIRLETRCSLYELHISLHAGINKLTATLFEGQAFWRDHRKSWLHFSLSLLVNWLG